MLLPSREVGGVIDEAEEIDPATEPESARLLRVDVDADPMPLVLLLLGEKLAAERLLSSTRALKILSRYWALRPRNSVTTSMRWANSKEPSPWFSSSWHLMAMAMSSSKFSNRRVVRMPSRSATQKVNVTAQHWDFSANV
jgi:hypothetical protein